MEAAKADKQPSSLELQQPPPVPPASLLKMITVSSIAAGLQFGWALQLSLLTPYVQLLGISHKHASLIWLCGPISGLIVQPLVGHYSDRCTSRFGRRRPFIAAGAGLVAIAVFLIGYAADLGHVFGDKIGQTMKPRAIAIFVVGFWILDVANNTLQGPCRAFLADLAAGDQRKMRTANAFFSFFMAVGNVLGYSAGASKHLYKIFPFSATRACDSYCANLKSCFFISIALLVTLTILALTIVRERPLSESEPGNAGDLDEAQKEGETAAPVTFFRELFGALKDLSRPMKVLLLVTCLNWIGWFPFLLYDTDWMGREVYGGDPDKSYAKDAFNHGVRVGSLGLMLNSVVLGVMSLGIEHSARALGGAKRLWGGVNFILAISLLMTVVITKKAESARHLALAHLPKNSAPPRPSTAVQGGALAIFSVLGIPLAITYSIPFALASIFSSSAGAGQGLSLGVLNLSIVVPQMAVALLSGPWDSLWGGGNLPGFIVGAISAAASGVLALTMLPSPPPDEAAKLSGVGGFH